MNCKKFQDLLYEYLDEALDAKVHADAQQHIRQCDACLHAFQREQTFAKSIKQSLDWATADFSLDSQIQQNVHRILESKPTRSNPLRNAWQSFFSIHIPQTGVVAAFVGLFVIFMGIQFHRSSVKQSSPKTIASSDQYTCIINIPLQFQRIVFRRENNTVEDALISVDPINLTCSLEASNQSQPTPSLIPL